MPEAMTTDQRIRRVALLCCHFTRNLAYFRAGWTELKPRREGNFWITAIGNFIDVSVLEWCKLFGDDADNHHWKNIVTDQKIFRSELMKDIRITDREWKDNWKTIRNYRDQFVAHLDSEHTMHIPKMDIPERMVRFYYEQLRWLCSSVTVLAGGPTDMETYYIKCYEEAVGIYKYNKKP